MDFNLASSRFFDASSCFTMRVPPSPPFCSRMHASNSCSCSSMNRFCARGDMASRSNPECVTITASQLLVAMRLINSRRRELSKSALPAARMFAAGYKVSSSDENCPSM